MKKLHLNISSSSKQLVIGVILGAIASWIISLYFAERIPEPLTEIEKRAKLELFKKNFDAAVADYSRALYIDPTKALYWEGRAYSQIGRAIGNNFDIGLLAKDDCVQQWVSIIDKDGKAEKYLDAAYSDAITSFNRASTDGEKIAAQFILGLVRELQGCNDFSKYDFSPFRHYTESIIKLNKWEKTEQYSDIGYYSSPYSVRFILYWNLPWQAYSIRPLCTYKEAIESAFIRRLVSMNLSQDSIFLSSTLKDAELIDYFTNELNMRFK